MFPTPLVGVILNTVLVPELSTIHEALRAQDGEFRVDEGDAPVQTYVRLLHVHVVEGVVVATLQFVFVAESIQSAFILH